MKRLSVPLPDDSIRTFNSWCADYGLTQTQGLVAIILNLKNFMVLEPDVAKYFRELEFKKEQV